MENKCPNCGSESTFFNGTLYVCIKCQYEWVGKRPKGIPEDDIWKRMKEEDKDNHLAGY